jgi:hypothetical protein
MPDASQELKTRASFRAAHVRNVNDRVMLCLRDEGSLDEARMALPGSGRNRAFC